MVNCRVSSPPPEVHTAKVALEHSKPRAIHATRPRWRTPGRRMTHHSIAAIVPAVQTTDSHGAACSGGMPDSLHIAANSSTHRKLV